MDIHRQRMVNKNEMMTFRKYVLGLLQCDLCGKKNCELQMHEIVSRRRMLGATEEEMLLSYAPEICSLLCQHCHDRIAPTKEGQRRLLRFNITLYGRENVKAALAKVPERFRRDVELPQGR